MTELPPTFRYYPAAAAEGRVHVSDRKCASCESVRGWISEALLYTSSKLDDDAAFCPWCIADGAATERFGSEFNGVEGGVADPAEFVVVSERTPSFEKWQDWEWPVHCGVPAVYKGQPSGTELRADKAAFAAFLAELADIPWSRDEEYLAGFMDSLGTGAVAYRFDCEACGAPVLRWDSD